jgi:hypothetical protein
VGSANNSDCGHEFRALDFAISQDAKTLDTFCGKNRDLARRQNEGIAIEFFKGFQQDFGQN